METWSDAGDDIVQPNLYQKKTTANRTLIQKIETILASYEMQEKYSTKITQHSLDTIAELIKTKPEYFRMVESTLIRNINNDKIESHDIPYFITIISHLYNLLLITNMNNLKSNEDTIDTCSNILKFIFSVSIRESLVKIEHEQNSTLLLLCFDNIVDACIKLLKVNVSKPFTLLTENVYNEKISIKKQEKTKKKKSCIGCFGPCCYSE
jgi:hypothetical protein